MGWSGGPPNARGPPARADMGEGGTRPKVLQLDSTRLKALPGESWCMLLPAEVPVPLGVKLSDLHAQEHAQQARNNGAAPAQVATAPAWIHHLMGVVAQVRMILVREMFGTKSQ